MGTHSVGSHSRAEGFCLQRACERESTCQQSGAEQTPQQRERQFESKRAGSASLEAHQSRVREAYRCEKGSVVSPCSLRFGNHTDSMFKKQVLGASAARLAEPQLTCCHLL